MPGALQLILGGPTEEEQGKHCGSLHFGIGQGLWGAGTFLIDFPATSTILDDLTVVVHFLVLFKRFSK